MNFTQRFRGQILTDKSTMGWLAQHPETFHWAAPTQTPDFSRKLADSRVVVTDAVERFYPDIAVACSFGKDSRRPRRALA